MAKKPTANTSTGSNHKVKARKTRKGIHAKTKMSKNKNSKNYVKVSRGQNS
jgi:ribosome biogenesis protein Nip4